MASPHLSLSDGQPHQILLTPLDLSFPTDHNTQPTHTAAFLASLPPSPTLIAAATTLAALSDDRPPPISEEHDDVDLDDDDDDHSGGISIAPFDLQPYSVDMPLPEATALPTDVPEQQSHDVAEQLQMAMLAQIPSSTLSWQSALIHYNNNISPNSSMLSYIQASHPQLPTEDAYSYSSSYEQTLEPPPTLQEAHLSIQDKASFAPITSFFHYLDPRKRVVPGLDLIEVPESITRDDLQGDRYDWQGIDWAARDITRAYVRSNRFAYETTKLPRSLQQVRKHISPTPNKDSFFQFRRNNTRCRAFFPHFQLRNVLAVNSRNDIMYAYGHRIYRTDADGASPSVLVDLGKRLTPDGSITTMASQKDVLIAGAFEGEYAIVDLKSEYGSHCSFGRATDYAPDTKSRISNHMHLFESRTTYVPHAVLCSNDERLRVLDCVTNQFIHSFPYSAAVNSAATSPDGRMRVLVGDFQETLITNAETGEAFETLNSHTDDGFACAWADDGIHVATAAQDSTIVVWDARNWSKPLNVMISELSIPRSLHFSPIGSGPRVLVAAEADDYVNIINAQTFESKQVFDFFGPIGGVSFTPDGQSLFIANSERRFGGIIELDRTHWKGRAPKSRPLDDTIWEEQMTDWAPESELSSHDRVMSSDVERERRDLDLAFFV